jgi:hypothetical protein
MVMKPIKSIQAKSFGHMKDQTPNAVNALPTSIMDDEQAHIMEYLDNCK